MIKNALVVTIALFGALVFLLLGELSYLRPYRTALFVAHGRAILFFAAAAFLNLFAASYVLGRKVLFKDAGQKLRQLDKELATRTLHVVKE